MVRDLAQSILSTCGYSVLVPEGVDSVESMCRQCSGRVDLLLTDVVTPRVSG